jgi:hypothetical protein
MKRDRNLAVTERQESMKSKRIAEVGLATSSNDGASYSLELTQGGAKLWDMGLDGYSTVKDLVRRAFADEPKKEYRYFYLSYQKNRSFAVLTIYTPEDEV